MRCGGDPGLVAAAQLGVLHGDEPEQVALMLAVAQLDCEGQHCSNKVTATAWSPRAIWT